MPLDEENKTDEISINFTNTDCRLKEEFDYSNISPDDPKNLEINNKILFKGKLSPEKISKFIEPKIRLKVLTFKYYLWLSVNSKNNFLFKKRDKW